MKVGGYEISPFGIIAGGVVNVAATNVVVFAAMAFSGNLHGLASIETVEEALTQLHTEPLMVVILTILGSLASVLGGYIAASIAGREELLNGTLSSWLCVLLGLFSLFSVTSFSLFLFILGLIANPLLGLCGGYLHLRLKRA